MRETELGLRETAGLPSVAGRPKQRKTGSPSDCSVSAPKTSALGGERMSVYRRQESKNSYSETLTGKPCT